MQDVDAGIPLDTHMCYKENKAHKLCFTGENIVDNYILYLFWLVGKHCTQEWKLTFAGIQVIDWLLKWSFVHNRDAGRDLACVLLEDAHLQPVGLTSTLSFKQKAEFENAATFLDDTDALYRFVSSFLEALLYFNNFFCDNMKQSNMNVLFRQSALRHSAQNEPLELEISDGSSDSEDEIPRDQVLLKMRKGHLVLVPWKMVKIHVKLIKCCWAYLSRDPIMMTQLMILYSL